VLFPEGVAARCLAATCAARARQETRFAQANHFGCHVARRPLVLVSPVACEDRSYREIGAQINALTKPGGARADAIAQLARIGRRTLPQIETALHTASPHGKSNLIVALDAIGDPEAASIVQHFAVYDSSARCALLARSCCSAGLRPAIAARSRAPGSRAGD